MADGRRPDGVEEQVLRAAESGGSPEASGAGEVRVALRFRLLEGGDPGRRRGEPVTLGLPWPRGRLLAADALVLTDGAGRRRPLQARALDRWPDGSVRWALLDLLADTDAAADAGGAEAAPDREGGAPFTVSLAGESEEPPASPLRVVAIRAGLVEVVTGRARFRLETGGPFPFAAVEVDGRPALAADASGLVVVDEAGHRRRPRVAVLAVEEEGPVRVAVRVEATVPAPGQGPDLRLVGRFHFFAGSAAVRASVTLENPRPAGHPGGCWSLGSAGSVLLREVAFRLTLPEGGSATALRLSPERGAPFEELALPLELYQASSGGERWRSPVHVDRKGEVPLPFRGYRLSSAEAERSGLRATPAAVLETPGGFLAVAVERFWETFPKALEADATGVTLGLLPRQHEAFHELQGGEATRHRFHLAFAAEEVAGVEGEPLAWGRSPLLAAADPAWYAASGAVPRLVARAEDPNDLYLRLVDAAIEGDDSFFAKREAVDEYGWRHFGETYADHEAAFHEGPEPFVSHYNNQYDAVRGFAVQFLRSADPRWFRQMDELARHVADIDVYHTDGDKAAYNHGLFWHTVHYVDAGTSTHRSYPKAPGVGGGGPSPGHLYTAGLLLHHFLTGDPRSREVALELGRYVVDADDGEKTVFRFLDRGPTGHVTESGLDGFHGPGRTPANAVAALLDAHRLSGDRAYLEKAEELVRRVIHPDDDLEARNLLEAETRWYYTMFLQSLGRYLEHKRELGELDGRYAYAREALLRYARWAAEHEYPYLEKPEILEFPTETWAAQDMRKSEVFRLAARHSEGSDGSDGSDGSEGAEERRRFLERARFFFDTSTTQLEALPTRTRCRPLVILLSYGWEQAWADRYPEAAEPPPDVLDAGFSTPERFVPQKARAKRRLAVLAGVGLATLVGGLAAWLLALGG